MSSAWTRRLIGIAMVFTTFLVYVPVFAQTGGLQGKCTGQDGKLLAGYVVQVDRQDVHWSNKTKTNKKGEYVYIGLAPGNYKVTLVGPDGKNIYYFNQHVGVGDPTELNFDLAKIQAESEKEQKNNPEAQKQLAEQKQTASLKQMFDQGRTLYAQKQYTQAAAIFEQALPLAKDKNLTIVLGQLADTYAKAAGAENNPDVRKDDQAKSLDYYQKVLAADPTDPSLHNNLGSLYADMGKPDDAMAEFKKAADLDPTHASGYYYNLGAIMVNKGQMDAASEALKKATDLDPTNANAWYWYGTALMGKAQVKPDGTMVPVPGTIEAFQTYLKLQPSGQYAATAQASIDALTGKQALEYKKPKK